MTGLRGWWSRLHVCASLASTPSVRGRPSQLCREALWKVFASSCVLDCLQDVIDVLRTAARAASTCFSRRTACCARGVDIVFSTVARNDRLRRVSTAIDFQWTAGVAELSHHQEPSLSRRACCRDSVHHGWLGRRLSDECACALCLLVCTLQQMSPSYAMSLYCRVPKPTNGVNTFSCLPIHRRCCRGICLMVWHRQADGVKASSASSCGTRVLPT